MSFARCCAKAKISNAQALNRGLFPFETALKKFLILTEYKTIH